MRGKYRISKFVFRSTGILPVAVTATKCLNGLPFPDDVALFDSPDTASITALIDFMQYGAAGVYFLSVDLIGAVAAFGLFVSVLLGSFLAAGVLLKEEKLTIMGAISPWSNGGGSAQA